MNKKRTEDSENVNITSETEKVKEPKTKTKAKNKNKKDFFKGTYVGYTARTVLFAFLFFLLFGISLLLVSKFLVINEEKVTSYRENGSVDYKVYLKENNFYETSYLGKNMNYIASLIKNIEVNFNYQFMISEPMNLNFDYSVVANLKITDQSESSTFYEKEFIIADSKTDKLNNQIQYSLNKNVTIDYDYYNQIANDFISSYGVDGVSTLNVYLKINKNASVEKEQAILNNSNSMSLKIPLSQRAININIDDSSINSTNNIVSEKTIGFNNAIYVIFAVIFFIASVASLLRFLELLALLFPKKTEYDKLIGKILKEYDRLIVETSTAPDLEGSNIIKINRFEELLDARDNLKLPIMYYNLANHQKSHFFIRQGKTLYLMTVKAPDLEIKNEKKHN